MQSFPIWYLGFPILFINLEISEVSSRLLLHLLLFLSGLISVVTHLLWSFSSCDHYNIEPTLLVLFDLTIWWIHARTPFALYRFLYLWPLSFVLLSVDYISACFSHLWTLIFFSGASHCHTLQLKLCNNKTRRLFYLWKGTLCYDMLYIKV